MLSSTSNSKPQAAAAAPGRPTPWVRLWVLALSLALLLVGGWELGWRSIGFVASVEDDWGIWASRRRRVKDTPTVVALVGASRIQLGVEPEKFRAQSGRNAVMLAVDGNAPMPVLADLAEDPSFTGSVIVSYVPMFFAEAATNEKRVRKWLRKYRTQTWSSRFETALRIGVQERFVLRYPGLAPARIWEHLLEGTRPRLIYAPMRADRYRAANYDLIDIVKLRKARANRERRRHLEAQPLSSEVFEQRVEAIALLVRRILTRGGRVAFVRMPSVGLVRRLEADTWPRRPYWDRLAGRIAVPFIHFEDYPALSAFDCPDGSHLGAADAQAFTAALVKILSEKGFFDAK